MPSLPLLAIIHANFFLEVQNEVSVIASKQNIIGVTLCATKINENVADFIINSIQRLFFTTFEEGNIKLTIKLICL